MRFEDVMVNFPVFVFSEKHKKFGVTNVYFAPKEIRLFVVVVVVDVVSSSGTCVLLQRVKSKVGWRAGVPDPIKLKETFKKAKSLTINVP